MLWKISVDVKGRLVVGDLVGDRGDVFTARVRAIPGDPAGGDLSCLRKLARSAGTGLSDLLSRTGEILCCRPVVSEIMARGSGTRIGTIVTRGFRSRMAFGNVFGSIGVRHPAQLIQPDLVTEVEERVDADGNVLTALDEESVREAVHYLRRKKVESIAVLLLFSPLYPRHERRIAEIIAEEIPGVYAALSSEVRPVIGEANRWGATVLTAYVAHAVAKYVRCMSSSLQEAGFSGQLFFRRGDGGRATPRAVADHPAVLLPAVLGAQTKRTVPGKAVERWRTLLSAELGEARLQLRAHTRATAAHGHDGRLGAGFCCASGEGLYFDIEQFEARFPFVVNALGVLVDTEGPGEFRGPPGTYLEFSLCDRTRGPTLLRSYGALPEEVVLHGPCGPKGPVRDLDGQPLAVGERCVVQCTGGVGWGSPLSRSIERVQQDVIEGYVSVDRARDVYGVVLNSTTLEVGWEATHKLRGELRSRESHLQTD